MHILGIETSCDETAAAIVENGQTVLSNVIATSKKSFERLAGVIPEEAARKQVECIVPVISDALAQASMTIEEIDAIAVTRGPGLLGSLLVGTTAARMIAMQSGTPLIGVHHTLGHLSSTWLDILEKPTFPLLTLSASGGHTDLWLRTSHTKGSLLGRTRDDAAGEAFDKGASLLGLPYPGGPWIAKSAERGDPRAFDFPLPLREEPTLDFSFSGLKTALKYLVRDLGEREVRSRHEDIAASFQHTICMHLADRIEHAIKKYPAAKEIHVVGGVSANTYLRSVIGTIAQRHGITLRTPITLGYCTDNAAMIAAAGEFLVQEIGDAAYDSFETVASLALTDVVQ